MPTGLVTLCRPSVKLCCGHLLIFCICLTETPRKLIKGEPTCHQIPAADNTEVSNTASLSQRAQNLFLKIEFVKSNSELDRIHFGKGKNKTVLIPITKF